jgi:hypothetical protein
MIAHVTARSNLPHRQTPRHQTELALGTVVKVSDRWIAKIDLQYYNVLHGDENPARVSEGRRRWRRQNCQKLPGHHFYTRLNALLDADDFDGVVGRSVRQVLRTDDKTAEPGAGSVLPAAAGGYFEGIDSERGIAWRASDSLAVRAFLALPVDEPRPDRTTISRSVASLTSKVTVPSSHGCSTAGGGSGG